MKSFKNFMVESAKESENPYNAKKEPDLFNAWKDGYKAFKSKKKMPSYPDKDYVEAWKAGNLAAKMS